MIITSAVAISTHAVSPASMAPPSAANVLAGKARASTPAPPIAKDRRRTVHPPSGRRLHLLVREGPAASLRDSLPTADRPVDGAGGRGSVTSGVRTASPRHRSAT